MHSRLLLLLVGLAAVNAFVQPGGILSVFGGGRAGGLATRGSPLGLRAPRAGLGGGTLSTLMSGAVPPEGGKEGSQRARFVEKMRRVKAFTIDVGITPLTAKLSTNWAKDYLLDEGKPEERAKRVGKTAIVTGGSGGIGQQAALGLAARGFKVILAVRSVEKGDKARQQIHEAYPNAEISIKHLDLSSLKSVRSFAEQFGDRDLSVLVLNAGYGGGGEGGLTEDGLEWYFQVNHLGHFLLTHLLWPNLEAAKGDARVVSVSSVMHWKATNTLPEDLKDLDDWIKIPTGSGGEYRRSKLFNVMFSNFLAQMGNGVAAHAVNPGFVYSDIWRHETSDVKRKAYSAYCKTTEQGAVGIVRAATEEKYGKEKGLYLVDGKPARSSTMSHDERLAQWLWKTSERLTGIKEGGFGGGISAAFLAKQPGTPKPVASTKAPPFPIPVPQPGYWYSAPTFQATPSQPAVQPAPGTPKPAEAPKVAEVPKAAQAPKPAEVLPPMTAEASRAASPGLRPPSPSAPSAHTEDEIEALQCMHEVTQSAASKFDEIAKAAAQRLQASDSEPASA